MEEDILRAVGRLGGRQSRACCRDLCRMVEAAVPYMPETFSLEQLYPAASREQANCLFLCGLAQYYLAENDALLSEDDPELAPKAEKEAKESGERLRRAQSALLRCALEQAKTEGALEKEVEATTELAGLREAAKALQAKEGLSAKVKELLEVALDVTENVGMGRECEADREGGRVFGEEDY